MFSNTPKKHRRWTKRWTKRPTGPFENSFSDRSTDRQFPRVRAWKQSARSVRIYFPDGAGGGVTTSLCCAQAPSPKAVTITATTMIVFNSFNLSRLLSQQVAPVCLVRESGRRNAFLKFFYPSRTGRRALFGITGRSRACGHYFLLLLRTSSRSRGS